MMWPRGEEAAAVAAQAAGIPYCLSTVSVCSMEAVRTASSGALAFQLYVTKDRRISEQLIDRAAAAGYSSLFVTVDVPTFAKREIDIRNGLGATRRLSMRMLWASLLKPRWALRTILASHSQLGNFNRDPASTGNILFQAREIARLLDLNCAFLCKRNSRG